MIHRRTTRQIFVGTTPVGGSAPVSIQSMTPYPASDIDRNMRLIRALSRQGCDIIRMAIPDKASAMALKAISGRSPIPVVADIHFNHSLAILSAANKAAAVRINPGNLGSTRRLREVVDACRDNGISLRIGVNAGSLPPDVVRDHPRRGAGAMLETARRWIQDLEDMDFRNFKVSLKASSVAETIEANRHFSATWDYPLHLGLTEAGLPDEGMVVSAAAMAPLLLEGIGDTLRISLAGSCRQEVLAARHLLVSLGLRQGVRLVVCPGCGRSEINTRALARVVQRIVAPCTTALTVAVMGCAVNGPGEAATADIAVVGSPQGIYLYAGGKKRGRVDSSRNLEAPLRRLLEKASKGTPS